MWRDIPSFARNSQQSIVKMPKGSFRDCGLSNFIQGIFTREHLLNYPNVGASFEAFVIEEIIKGVETTHTTNWHYYYFCTRNGAEIDLVLQGVFGILPIEIKFGSQVKARQIQTLKKFVMTNHLPLGIVINNSDHVRLIADRIIQIPVTCI